MVYANEFSHKNTIGVGDFMPFKDKKFGGLFTGMERWCAWN
jgi:hypothetical protein